MSEARWPKPERVGAMVGTYDTLTLTEFLLARIAEDEDVARGTRDRKWHTSIGLQVRGSSGTVACWDCCGGNPHDSEPEQIHIATHDPHRVLAECAAKRRLVERLGGVVGARPPTSDLDEDGWELLCWETLYDLAAVYADHPDYREEWKP